MASRSAAIDCMRSTPPSGLGFRAGTPWTVPSLNEYSSLTSSMSDETAVFRCIRSSMSDVTRRIVSCVFRRSARSASVQSSPQGGIPSPPIVSAQWSTRRHTRTRKRKLPSRPLSLHSTSFSGGATNIT